MPNIITHTIFAEKVLETLSENKYKNIILNHKEEYRIGANGPDFLFFHNIFPLWKKQNKKIPKIGSKIHANNINLFYKTAIEVYHTQEEGCQKEAMASYIIGHYLHWQLDSIMHPYVVYRTGFGEKNSSGFHHRFESMMDTMLLKHYWNTTIKDFKTYEITKRSPYSVDTISAVYIPCVKACLNKTIEKSEVKQSLIEWEKAQKGLYDPSGIKFFFIQLIEKIIKQPWAISGSMVLAKEDTNHDILNIEHNFYRHPCTGEEFNDSVFDLFDKAMENAMIGLPLLFEALESNNVSDLLEFIDDVSYNNGCKERLPRKYKKVLYE